ncbi:MAG: anthranilate phosphoribosyltransferase [Candidatus Omnitrophica bacterium]|nr:anthranilate phosphoribosyltransferase [Candidatus Omnitrophota bacterium]
MIKEAILQLFDDKDLNPEQMQEVMQEILSGKVNTSQLSAFLVLLRKKGETAQELFSATEVLLRFCKRINITDKDKEAILDTCGTGGDNQSTFNISTAVAFVASAVGVKVAKHGNRAISSTCGSADILEHLGIDIHMNERRIKKALKEIGIAFLFAPDFHPAMKYALPVRKELGIRTIFNLIGPLSNPVNITHQLLGVYEKRWLMIMGEVLKKLGRVHAMVVFSSEGLDEISINEKTYVVELKDNKIRTYTLNPKDFGFYYSKNKHPSGKDPATNARILMDVFKGKRGIYRDVVLLNSGAAIYVADKTDSIQEGIKLAKRAIDEGLVLKKFNLLREFSKS